MNALVINEQLLYLQVSALQRELDDARTELKVLESLQEVNACLQVRVWKF